MGGDGNHPKSCIANTLIAPVIESLSCTGGCRMQAKCLNLGEVQASGFIAVSWLRLQAKKTKREGKSVSEVVLWKSIVLQNRPELS